MNRPVTPFDGCGRCLIGVIRLSRLTDKTSSLCVQQAVAILKHRATAQAGISRARLSFTATLRIVRDHARTQYAALTPAGLAAATQAAITDMLADLLPPRRPRQYPRRQKPRPLRYPKGKDTTPVQRSITSAITISPPASTG